MKKFLIPILIYIIFVILYVGYSYFANSNYLFGPVWDIRHYIDIAENGYKVYPCTPGVEYPSGEICGNAGWSPFWPLIIKIIRPLFGGNSPLTGTVLAFFLTFISFQVFYFLIEKEHRRTAAILSLAVLAFAPGSFYLLTGFPYALLLSLFFVYLIFLARPSGTARTIALFILGAAISLTYPTGILFAAVPATKLIFEKTDLKNSIKTTAFWLNLAKYIIPFVLGVILLWSYFYFKFDDFLLQIHFQEKYQRTWAIPFYVIYQSLRYYPLFSPENAVILWYGIALLIFIPYKISKELWIFGLILYLFSLSTGTTMSIFRHYLICFPVYMIIGTSPRPLWLKILYIAAGLLLAVKILFPLYIADGLI
jgi:hypothetical protein